ncbi:MAG TPA: UDP-3-O-acyl-N-acetylglucosamine deacetylase [Acidobacteriota bacterium]|nr:UDP-3-O-acyl-N-acetylglucosamine deacetylase [Acidobacteriota bacterium]
MLRNQHTLRNEIHLEGIGLHTGYPVQLRLVPAPANTGIIFRRTDLKYFEIEARRAHVARVSYATTLMKKGVMISTVEHLLSSLYGLGIDNLYLDLNSMEVPILDGSGLRFMEEIEKAGIAEQDFLRRYIVIEEPVEVRHGDKVAGVYPDPVARATYIIDFEHNAIGKQNIHIELNPESYRREIGTARTFGFMADVQYLKKCGLIRGGSLDNAVVLDETGIVNNHLRFPDEFVRHKLLDLLGDISLVGYPIIGHLYAERAGHAIHAALADQMTRQSDHYRVCTLPDLEPALAAQAGRTSIRIANCGVKSEQPSRSQSAIRN